MILVTLDTTRADHLGCYGYFRDTSPNLDAFAEEAVLCEHAVTVAGTTLPVHVSIWTSVYPSSHGVFSNYCIFEPNESGKDLQTMAQLFQSAGYRTAGFASSRGFLEGCGGEAGFETYVTPEDAMRPAEGTVELVRDWLDEEPARPFFLWVHFFDAHSPYEPPGSYAKLFATDDELIARIEETGVPADRREEARLHNNLYDAEIRYMDHYFGELMELFDDKGLYDRSCIVVSGDHGEGLWQHGFLQHGVINNEQLRVPMIIKFPEGTGVGPGRVSRLVSVIDILPTITATLDLPLVTEQFEGIDIFLDHRDYALAEREHTKRFGEELGMALVGEGWKFRYYTESPEQLFDLREDPWELEDVIEEHPEVAAEMKAELLRLVHAGAQRDLRFHVKTGEALEAHRETLQALRSLGYAR